MRKQTKRKVWGLINPIQHAAYQASKLTQAEWVAQMVPVQTAVEQLLQGNWDKGECWQPMFECLNRIESLTKLNRVDALEFIGAAQNVYITALDRHEKTGAKAFKADEITTLREVVQVYGDLLGECTHRQFSDACTHTAANVSRIVNQRAGRHVAGCYIESTV
jgi:hypothetical protein